MVKPSLKRHLFIVHKIRNISQYLIDSGIKEEEISPEKPPNKSGQSSESSPELESLDCDICQITFENISKKRTHMRSHGMAFIKKSRRINDDFVDITN